MTPRVRLLSRVGCHLCDEARSVLRSVVGSDFEEVDIDACPELLPRYSEEVPVVFVDGRQISYWTIDADRLRAALGGGFGPAAQCATSESAKETNACVE